MLSKNNKVEISLFDGKRKFTADARDVLTEENLRNIPMLEDISIDDDLLYGVQLIISPEDYDIIQQGITRSL